jgi:CheY-like chemotaxis protein
VISGLDKKGDCLVISSIRIRILVVDDFEPWRQQICSMLQTRPELRVVAEVGDGLEAVQKARELKPDLILLDIALPNLNGLEAAKRICQLAPGTKIIFVTQNSDKDAVRSALSSGAQGYQLLPAFGSGRNLKFNPHGSGSRLHRHVTKASGENYVGNLAGRDTLHKIEAGHSWEAK